MYLQNIKLWNFRKYGNEKAIDISLPDLDLDFSKGLNVLIGENDSGKTAIIDAIKLVLKTHSYEWLRVDFEDFYKDANRLRIELLFKDLANEEAKNFTEWLSWEGVGQVAKPTLKIIYDVSKNSNKIFPSDIKAGTDEEGYLLNAEAKDFLKVTYLKPLRDAKNELVPKKNSRLSQIFQEHEAFKNREHDHPLIEIFSAFNESIKQYFVGFENDGVTALNDVKGKELKEEIDKYLKSFYDHTKQTDIAVVEKKLKIILEKLELLVKDEINIGLGTLNRLFMAAELLHLNKKNYDGIRLGLIEELEAHLHPQAQMQVVESLQEQKEIQLILSTHSPNLASKVKLENIILCSGNYAFPMGKNYTKLHGDDYVFLERFLDATKANLFFAKGIIMVEGWSEELLIPILAKKMKKLGLIKKDLTEAGVSIVNVASTAFLRYSRIFLREKEPFINQIPISIVTDSDVRYYEKVEFTDDKGVIIKNEKGKIQYNYKIRDFEATRPELIEKENTLKETYNHQKVKIFIAKNWTLEYSLLLSGNLKNTFCEVVKSVHSDSDWDSDFGKELAKKLINRGLDKVEIAYRLAQKIEEDMKKENPEIRFSEPDSIDYLLNAIAYVCN